MPDLICAEVTDRHGTAAEYLDLAALRKLPPRQRAQLDALAAGLVDDVARVLGLDHGYARKVIVAELIRLVADEAAYERVCERRGVLPL